MKNFSTIALDVDARGVALLTLNRPERKNAINAEMMQELSTFAVEAPKDARIKAVVISGSERCFCAGADLEWMMTQIESDRAGRMREAKRLALMLKALNEMPLPLIGKLEGVALGGGMGMAAICDIAIAAKDCRFGFTETRLGIIPATISPYVLAKMGEGRARQVFMSARLFEGDDACRLGVVARSVDAVDLDGAIEEEVAPYLRLPTATVGRAKRLARSLGPVIDEGVIDETIARLADAWETAEAKEGIAAFLEKRRPIWD